MTPPPIEIGPSPDELRQVNRMIEQQRHDEPSMSREPPECAFWNGIARAWFVEVNGEAVRLDPQPPAPTVRGIPVSPRIDL